MGIYGLAADLAQLEAAHPYWYWGAHQRTRKANRAWLDYYGYW